MMFRCVVHLFGFPKNITSGREVDFELRQGDTLAKVVAMLRKKLPALEGFAIVPGENKLVDNFKFNLNGQLYYDDLSAQIHEGDRIALLIPVTGG
jgi:molybdopterin converting factor small subunit